jgi:tRNA (guanosine-2'-O-)-methyltransferase
MTAETAAAVLCCFFAAACGGHSARSPAQIAGEPARARSISLNQGPDQARVPGGPEECLNARDDDGNGLIDEGCGVPTGLVQFVIAWDAPTADVDLLVTDPKGELADVGRPTSSGLVKERDCPGRRDECRGKNFENVYLEKDEAKRGTYKVSVRLEQLEDEDVPIRVTLGARVGPKIYETRLSFTHPEERADFVFVL